MTVRHGNDAMVRFDMTTFVTIQITQIVHHHFLPSTSAYPTIVQHLHLPRSITLTPSYPERSSSGSTAPIPARPRPPDAGETIHRQIKPQHTPEVTANLLKLVVTFITPQTLERKPNRCYAARCWIRVRGLRRVQRHQLLAFWVRVRMLERYSVSSIVSVIACVDPALDVERILS
jgi:hypothetical protein